MAAKSKKADRRTNRTRRSLSSALVKLVEEKRFDDITVQDVIDRADVGRSTFYSHFRDKEDLFQKNWERFLDMLAQQVDWDKAGQASFMPVTFLFSHLQAAQTFYQGLVRSRKADSLFKSGVEYFSQKIEAGAVLCRLYYTGEENVEEASQQIEDAFRICGCRQQRRFAGGQEKTDFRVRNARAAGVDDRPGEPPGNLGGHGGSGKKEKWKRRFSVTHISNSRSPLVADVGC